MIEKAKGRESRLTIMALLSLSLAVPAFAWAGPPHGGHSAPMVTTTSSMQHGKHRKLKPQTHCPITGKKLENHDVYIDYDGQRVYFCCPACKKKFLQNPQAVFDKFEKEGVVPENVQKTCPVCGAPVDENSKWFMYKGRRIYYGCPGCDKKFLEDPDKYLKKLGRPGAAAGHGMGGHEQGHHGEHGKHHRRHQGEKGMQHKDH